MILIVDDDPAVARTFARMLTLEGHAVHTAGDAQAALRAVDAYHPEAVLLDLRMLQVDGLVFLRQLRARPDQRETPVAIITGDYFVNDAVSAALRELGATIYFKPVWLADLVKITQRLLEPSSNRSLGGRGLKLLLVDDCVAERDFYEMALEPEFNVLTADRGDEGIAVATRTHPDAIVLDVVMPGIDGWETCTRIKSDPDTWDIPVILLTGADDRDLSRHAMAVGASALLRKPCPTDQLRDEILAAVTKH